MATKTRSKRAGSGSRRKSPARKKAPARKARAPKVRAKGAAGSRTAAAAGKAELAALKREKSALEKRLTETVREIGQLRHHEARAMQLDRQLKERDETIAQLRSQLSEARTRHAAAIDDEEIQPSLALGSRIPRDLDDLDEELDHSDEDDDLI